MQSYLIEHPQGDMFNNGETYTFVFSSDMYRVVSEDK